MELNRILQKLKYCFKNRQLKVTKLQGFGYLNSDEYQCKEQGLQSNSQPFVLVQKNLEISLRNVWDGKNGFHHRFCGNLCGNRRGHCYGNLCGDDLLWDGLR